MGPFHSGEIQVQERAGLRSIAERTGRMVGAQFPEAAQEFIALAPFLAVGLQLPPEAGGGMWATLLTGEAGFLFPADAGVELVTRYMHPLLADDPWLLAPPGTAIGTCALEPATRRRMRLNGIKDGPTHLKPEQVYANCPKYITVRDQIGSATGAAPVASHGEKLDGGQKAWIEAADTFFIATQGNGGADCSHRGGDPGFVQVNGNTLHWADFPGNAMFNTLGNLQLDAHCGLFFWDFAHGHTLQLSGRATTVWHNRDRGVQFEVAAWRQVLHATPLRYCW